MARVPICGATKALSGAAETDSLILPRALADNETAFLRTKHRHHYISHELAHAVDVPDHPLVGPVVYYMRYVTDEPNNRTWDVPGSHTRYCTAQDDANYNEVNRFLRLR